MIEEPQCYPIAAKSCNTMVFVGWLWSYVNSRSNQTG